MINKVILIGNVGADPEIRTLESGVKMARIRIATTERIYNREAQESRDHTEWHSVVLWRNLADVADRFIRKGSQVYIEGRVRRREWTDQQGVERASFEILADDRKMLGRRTAPFAAGRAAGIRFLVPAAIRRGIRSEWQLLFGRRVSVAATCADAGCSGGEPRRSGRPSLLTAEHRRTERFPQEYRRRGERGCELRCGGYPYVGLHEKTCASVAARSVGHIPRRYTAVHCTAVFFMRATGGLARSLRSVGKLCRPVRP